MDTFTRIAHRILDGDRHIDSEVAARIVVEHEDFT
jgi:hypothetical protein